MCECKWKRKCSIFDRWLKTENYSFDQLKKIFSTHEIKNISMHKFKHSLFVLCNSYKDFCYLYISLLHLNLDLVRVNCTWYIAFYAKHLVTQVISTRMQILMIIFSTCLVMKKSLIKQLLPFKSFQNMFYIKVHNNGEADL